MRCKKSRDNKDREGDSYLTRSAPGSVEINDADSAFDSVRKVCCRSNKIDHFARSCRECTSSRVFLSCELLL